MKQYTLRIDGKDRVYGENVCYAEIAREYQHLFSDDILLVRVEGRFRELSRKVQESGTLQLITAKDAEGNRTYRRTLIFLMLKAAYDLRNRFGISELIIEHTIGSGLFCTADQSMDDTYVKALKMRMRELVISNQPIRKDCMQTDEAIAMFERRNMSDKARLFRYRRSSRINVYELDDYVDYCYGSMLPSTGYLKYFDLETFEGGLILNMPPAEHPREIRPFVPYRKLFAVQQETNQWGRLMGIRTAADLNDCITREDINRLILVQEALQEKKIAEIAEDIYRKGKRIVLIAGPSSSGKTTFSHRLSVQLETMGLHPHPIPVDNYFINREDMKPGPDGQLDFEALEAVDTKQFNEDIRKLLAGEKVELPVFNFITGKREYKGGYEQLQENDILVAEGIHCLNEELTSSLPRESKYKIYISALTVLNIDDHNRIPTTDARLLRRLIRDARTRGRSAKETLEGWASVRRGEERNIFPYQEEADAMFNSVLIYELAVLKPYAEALLFGVNPEDAAYSEARKLLKFLDYFVTIQPEAVPTNSILREFIGGGCFHV